MLRVPGGPLANPSLAVGRTIRLISLGRTVVASRSLRDPKELGCRRTSPGMSDYPTPKPATGRIRWDNV